MGRARAQRSFVCVNCAAVPDSLFESELFGYERGAFTGAQARYDGRLQQADGGTLFLDEIGDMSLVNQAKILRAIEQKQLYRIGGRRPERLDIRLICATNQNLLELMTARKFRGDLYYRLNVINVSLPPLRHRLEDMALLFNHFMRALTPAEAAVPRTLTAPALELFEVLKSTRWNKSEAAKRLRCSRMTVYRKISKYELTLSLPPPAPAPDMPGCAPLSPAGPLSQPM